jgi:DDE superfamily endonuclease
MLKTELPPALDWFAGLSVLVDLGYLGIQTDYAGELLERPHKKPRKSKQHPDTCLTETQKADNKALSQVPIWIEHAIAGMKRYNILVHRFRNLRENFQDDVIAICAGLWNFSLAY